MHNRFSSQILLSDVFPYFPHSFKLFPHVLLV